MAEEDFSSLSIEDKIAHKSWKARLEGYEDLKKKLSALDPETESYEFSKWSGSLNGFALDANMAAQEAGLACILSFAENAPDIKGVPENVIPAIIDKGLGAMRAGTKAKSLDIILMLVEADVPDPVIEALIPGLSHKLAKVVTGCVNSLKEIIKQFGCKTVDIKPLLKQLPKLFGHSDKNVRAEATQLTIEMYKWIGKAIEPSIKDLKPVQIKDLQDAFDKLPSEKPVASRLLRSQQAIIAAAPPPSQDFESNDQEYSELEEEPVIIDPYDLAEPVDITKKLPKDFYTLIASSKWKERVEALEPLKAALDTPRLVDNGNYAELISTLAGKILDVNINVGNLCIACIDLIAAGLRKEFSPHKPTVVPPLIEKLKEKKVTVLEPLRKCLDSVSKTVTISELIEDICTATGHKNPNVKAETLKWLTRILSSLTSQPPSTPEIKTLCTSLFKSIDDGDTGVRESAAEAIGTLIKLVGDKFIKPFLEKTDSKKTSKIDEYKDKATISLKAAAPVVKPPPPVATPSAAPKIKKPPVLSSTRKPSKEVDSVASPTEAPKALPKAAPPVSKAPPKLSSKPPVKKPAAAPSGAKPSAASKSVKDEKISFKYSQEDVDSLIGDHIPSNLIQDLNSTAWKTRLAAIESIYQHIDSENPDNLPAELIVRQMNKKPGPKESNFQVTSKMFSIFALLAEKIPSFSPGSAALSIPALVDKLGDIKLKKPAGDALVAYAEAISLQFVLSQAYAPIKAQKAPKIQADALSWMKNTLTEFGIAGLSIPVLVDFIKTLLGSSNATVRSNAVQLLAELRVFVGPALRKSVEDLNPNLLSNIDAEFNKVSSREAPAPTRGAPPPTSNDAGGEAHDVLDDLFPRVDISLQINSKLAEQLGNANWKIRKEGLDAIVAILDSTNKRIKPTIGDLAGLLKARLSDANKNLAINALDIIGETAKAMGKPFEKHCKILVGSVAGCLSDQKVQVRTAAFNSLTSIREACGVDPMIPGVASALVPENSVQRKELTKWLADNLELVQDKLPDLSPLVSPLISCLQDKTSDVRKQAQTCLRFTVQSVGFSSVKEKASSLKGATLQAVMPLIDSLRSDASSPNPVGNKSAPQHLRPPSALSSSNSAGLGGRQLSSGPSSRPDSAAEMPAKKKAPLLGKRPTSAISSNLSRSNSSAPPNTSNFPILQLDARAKDQRLSREKSARWVFDSLPADLIQYIQDQFSHAFSSELKKSMFSTDHYKDKEYMNAVNTLYDIITCSEYDSVDKYQLEYNDFVDRVVDSSDLILKYLTLRIHDSATTLCLRCLETLEQLLQLLSKIGYSLPDNEISVFLPAIINKMGDNKEAMKVKLGAIFKQAYSLYPLNKMFTQIMDIGLKSKNAKVRAECLEQLAKLIRENDASVCNPSKSLPIIAKHIADRDSGVRTGAINVISEVYILTGEAVYKYLGKIGDKEKSYLEERFKRITPHVTPNPEPTKLQEDTGSHIFSFQRKDSVQPDPASLHLPGATPTSISPIQSSPRTDIPEFSPVSPYHPIPQPSPRNQTSFVPSATSPGIPQQYPIDHQNNSFSLEMSRLDLPRVSDSAQTNLPTLSPYQNNYSRDQDRYSIVPANAIMERLGDQIAHHDIYQSIEGLREFESQISGGFEVISPYLNNIVLSIAKKVRYLNLNPFSADSPPYARLIKYLVNSLVQIFSTSELARNIEEVPLHDLINQILIMLEISKTTNSESSLGFSRALNILMVRILDHCCPNSAFRCMLNSLQQLHDPNHVMEVQLSEHSMMSLSEMICKCIAKLNRAIAQKLASQELVPEILLYDINTILISVPSEYLRNPNIHPEFKETYKMVKTVIYDLLQVLKNDFFLKFRAIEEHRQNNMVHILANHLIESRKKSLKRRSTVNAQPAIY